MRVNTVSSQPNLKHPIYYLIVNATARSLREDTTPILQAALEAGLSPRLAAAALRDAMHQVFAALVRRQLPVVEATLSALSAKAAFAALYKFCPEAEPEHGVVLCGTPEERTVSRYQGLLTLFAEALDFRVVDIGCCVTVDRCVDELFRRGDCVALLLMGYPCGVAPLMALRQDLEPICLPVHAAVITIPQVPSLLPEVGWPGDRCCLSAAILKAVAEAL